MSTGPDHYQAAEALLAKADETTVVHYSEMQATESRWSPAARANLLAEAQVHATLACAAAYIEPIVMGCAPGEGDDTRLIVAWAEAVSS